LKWIAWQFYRLALEPVKYKGFLIFIFVFALLAANVRGQSKAASSQSKGKSAKTPVAGKKGSAPVTPAKKAPAVPQSKELVQATTALKTALEEEIALRENNLKSLITDVERKKALLAEGILSKAEVEKSEGVLAAARAELESRRQNVNQEITQADNLIAEVYALEQLAKTTTRRLGNYVSTAALIRYNGTSAWTLSNISKVEGFFTSQFGRSLPISAFGQTATHDRLNFDHRNSVDVAIHPDSAEGQAVIGFLRNAGIPFLAFRQAVPGSATGAHIHIGYPSHRMY
jgi:hypothetical protein